MDNTPEKVAFDLLIQIAVAEEKTIYAGPTLGGDKPDRKWILDTYADCLRVVRTAIKPSSAS
jgi:hypothetical protein